MSSSDSRLSQSQRLLRDMEEKYESTLKLKDALSNEMQSALERAKLQFARFEQESHQQLTQLRSDLQSTQNESSQHRSQAQLAQSSISSLQQQLIEITQARDDIEKKFRQFQQESGHELTALRSALESSQSRHYNLNLQLRGVQLHSTGLKLRVRQREEQINSLNSTIADMQSAFQTDRQQWLDETHNTKEKLISTMRQSRAQSEEIRNLQTDLAAKRAELTKLQQISKAQRETTY